MFRDPEGMGLSIREDGRLEVGPSRAELASPALGRVAIRVPDAEVTAGFLVETLGFRFCGNAGDRTLLGVGGELVPPTLEIVGDRACARARLGAGVVHHAACRTPDDSSQASVRQKLLNAGVAVSEPKDRSYFRSIYARIPGGVIIEIATDGPGFAIDEPVERLGRSLRLPSEHEAARAQIESRLAPLDDLSLGD